MRDPVDYSSIGLPAASYDGGSDGPGGGIGGGGPGCPGSMPGCSDAASASTSMSAAAGATASFGTIVVGVGCADGGCQGNTVCGIGRSLDVIDATIGSDDRLIELSVCSMKNVRTAAA